MGKIVEIGKLMDKDPIPPVKSGRPRTSTGPYEAMKIGQSFYAGLYSEDQRIRVSNQMAYYAEKTGFTFESRTVDGYIKVWRTK